MQQSKANTTIWPEISVLGVSEWALVSGGGPDGGAPPPPPPRCTCEQQRDGSCKIVCKD